MLGTLAKTISGESSEIQPRFAGRNFCSPPRKGWEKWLEHESPFRGGIVFTLQSGDSSFAPSGLACVTLRPTAHAVGCTFYRRFAAKLRCYSRRKICGRRTVCVQRRSDRVLCRAVTTAAVGAHSSSSPAASPHRRAPARRRLRAPRELFASPLNAS
jgi:hypothetical protein